MSELIDNTYVVFDLETTGLDPKEGNTIIEIGAVRVKNMKVIDRFSELINPNTPLSADINRITGITDDMLKDCDTEENVLKRFIAWAGDDILVAHNASFDLSFIKIAFLKYDLGRFNYDVIDTLGISRFLEPFEKYHNLTVLMNRYKIVWDEGKHHRADYDSEGTSRVLYAMLTKLREKNIVSFENLSKIPRIILNKRI